MFAASLFLSLQTVAQSGEIAPDLLEKLERGGPTDGHAVIIRMKDAIDHRMLMTTAENKVRGERVKRVVQELKGRTERSQRDLRARLDEQEKLGRIKKMKPFWIFNGIAATAPADVIRELAARADVLEVVPDTMVALAAPLPAAVTALPQGWNLERIGAHALWDAGYSGQGAVVATLDTGVDIAHPGLGPKWRGGSNSWFDPFLSTLTPSDALGHGTWTMGVLTGGDTTGNPVGVAPGAAWIAAKIFSDAGTSTYSVIHQAFQWTLDPDGDPATDDAPHVVNCSWGVSAPGSMEPEFRPDVQALRAADISVVFAAGNEGPGENTSISPANYPEPLAVGMTDGSDAVDPRSSRGPSAFDGVSLFPSLTAPGAGVRTTDLWFGSPDLGYTTVNGTSFAAPHVAGALALLLSGNPALTAGEREAALLGSTFDLGASGPDMAYGSGFLSVDDAARRLGILAPLPLPGGDVNGNGAPDLADVLSVLREAMRFPATVDVRKRVLAEGDVFPRTGGVPAPDGTIAIEDALTLLRAFVNGN